MRVCEMPIPKPSIGAVETGKASLALPAVRRDRRRMFRKLKCAVPDYAPLCLDTNDPETVGCAFRQRLLRQVPDPNPTLLQEFQAFVEEYVSHLPRARTLEFEEWLEGTSYNEQRKNQLRAAHDELRGGRPTRRQASHIDSFVKSESYPTYKHARMINSRSDAFKVFSGPMIKAVEQVVYELPEFIKHVPVPERPARVMSLFNPGCIYYATDFTAFESHFTPKLLDVCECALYRHVLAEDRNTPFLCETLMGPNRMRTRTGVHAVVRGRRMSGDMCTSLGNGFTNLMLAKFIVARKGGTISGLVEGDDGIFASSVELTAEDYAQLGFTIKIERVSDPCKASFCGMIFAESGQIIRDPRKFLENFGWTGSFINAGPYIMDQLLRAKALSTLFETPHCPIVAVLAHHALKLTTGVVPRFVSDGFHEPHDVRSVVPFAPTLETRVLFESLFNISIPVQLAAEAAIVAGDLDLLSSLVPAPQELANYARDYLLVT